MKTSKTTSATKGKRTNSLAFAQSDCHTCASEGDQCDRRRPRCSTCLTKGRKCDGFATSLSWNPKRMFSVNQSTANEQDSAPILPCTETVSGSPNANEVLTTTERQGPPPTPFRFRLVGNPSRQKKRRRTCDSQAADANQCRPVVQDDIPGNIEEEEPNLAGENIDMVPGGRSANEIGEMDMSDVSLLHDFDLCSSAIPSIFGSASWLDFGVPEPLFTEASDLFALPRTPPAGTERAIEFLPEAEFSNDPPTESFGPLLSEVAQTQTQNELASSELTTLSCAASNFPTTTPMFNISSKDHDWLFELYDSEFCVLPLTSDAVINPFRCTRQTSHGSRLLCHAILALCYRHLNRMTSNWSDEVVEHRGKAAQLLENALRTIQSQNSLHLLEPILILFTLDCTLSATGQWNTHLKRAHSVLQACGGPNSLIAPRQRSQVGMLLWWDATITLVSRRCPIFDRSYLEYCIRWEKLDEWSFFDLTGCPQELFVLLYNLSELAQQSEIASSMTWLTFNITPIIEAEEKLNQWQNKFVPLPQDQNLDISDEDLERQLHEQQDRYHCAEAWRCALILYIESVFKRDSSQRRSFSLTLMARKTLDHIRCCRRTSQTQKQLLLPIFLAGSETYDNDMRNFVKDYCLYWAEKSRYSMFSSVPMLLEEIWTTDQWWGAIIDSKSKSTSSDLGKASTQLLLG